MTRRGLGSWALALALAALAVGCKGRERPAPAKVAGLAAVPASATAVVSISVPRVAASPLVQRAVERLLLQDQELALRWQRLREGCKLDIVASVKQVVLALGPSGPTGAPVLMVVTGDLAESELAACVRTVVGAGGGTLSAKTSEGRTLYQAKDGDRTVWFGFGRADTVVLSSNEAFVVEALSTGQKLEANRELSGYLELVDQRASIWATGQVEPAVAERVLAPSAGALRAGPRGFALSADVTTGASLTFEAVMASEDDAKALELLAKQQIGLLAMVAQAKGLGRVVGKVKTSVTGKVAGVSAALDPTEINQLLSAVDSATRGSQDAPPAAPSQPRP
ncbi:MAG: hypothetical protein R3B48_11175 [Kofleriaceae bacterium]